MLISIEPWGVRIIESTWPPGEQTEEMFMQIKDTDEKENQIREAKVNRRLKPGDDPFQSVRDAAIYENVHRKTWQPRD